MVERYPDTVEVSSSSLLAPTKEIKGLWVPLLISLFFMDFPGLFFS